MERNKVQDWIPIGRFKMEMKIVRHPWFNAQGPISIEYMLPVAVCDAPETERIVRQFTNGPILTADDIEKVWTKRVNCFTGPWCKWVAGLLREHCPKSLVVAGEQWWICFSKGEGGVLVPFFRNVENNHGVSNQEVLEFIKEFFMISHIPPTKIVDLKEVDRITNGAEFGGDKVGEWIGAVIMFEMASGDLLLYCEATDKFGVWYGGLVSRPCPVLPVNRQKARVILESEIVGKL